jgi:hypothetical protein
MKDRFSWSHPLVRNSIGVLVLMLAWYLPDRFFLAQREGFQKFLPYLLLLTMYGWIVFHNRVLIDRLYFSDRRHRYFLWAGLVMIIGSLNIYLTIMTLFGGVDPLPQILGFWVFTIAGAGVYLLFRYRDKIMERQAVQRNTIRNNSGTTGIANFDFTADGRHHSLSPAIILYIESLENYIRVIAEGKVFLVRMPMKEAEQKLSAVFVRISRSHLVNPKHVETLGENVVVIGGKELKIGKVYKKYVQDAMS